MHATVLTFLLVTGAQGPSMGGQWESTMIAEGCNYARYDRCGCAAGRCRGDVVWGWLFACLGPMPQSCYAPRFGCCPDNNRYLHRYPARHGYYYRQAYNYRHLFDYPWHATPQEPQGFFTSRGSKPLAEEILRPHPEPGGTPSGPLPLVPTSLRPANETY